MRGVKFVSEVIIFAAIAALAGCERGEPSSPAASATAADDAVQLKILDYDALQKLIAAHRGQVVVVDVWSTGCPPCMAEFPRLVALHRKYGDRVGCISLSLDYEGIGKPEDVRPAVLQFLQKQHAALDNVLAADEADVTYKKLGVASIPLVMVYDRKGTPRGRFQEEEATKKGPAPKPLYDRVEAQVEELLAEN